MFIWEITILKRKNQTSADKIRLHNFRQVCQNSVEQTKVNYVKYLENKFADPNTSQKSF